MDSSEDGFYGHGTKLQQRKAALANKRAIQSQDYYNNGMRYSNSNPTIIKYVPSQTSGLDAFRQSTRESNINGRLTLNQNYIQGRGGGQRNNAYQQQRDGYSSIEPTDTMIRRKNIQNRNNVKSQIFSPSPANELSPITGRQYQQFNTIASTKSKHMKPPKYHNLLNPGTLNLTDQQVKLINDMHNDILNVNLMQQQLSLQAQTTQQNPQFERQFDFPDPKLSYTMGRPPKPKQSKKQRLKELLNEGQYMGDSSAPITPAGQYFDRSQTHSIDYQPRRYVQRKSNPIELWEYLTGRMLEQFEKSPMKIKKISRSQLLCLKWAKLARKMLAKHDAWGQIKIKRSPIECWKKLLIKADQLNYLILSSNKAMITRIKQKDAKTGSLLVQGRWNKLINGMLQSTQYRWIRLVKGFMREGYIQPKSMYSLTKKELVGGKSYKTQRLGVIGRWSTLIHGIRLKHQNRTRHTSLLMCGRWSKFARKILAKDRKLRNLDINGRWRWLAQKLLKKAKPPNTVDQRWINLVKAAQIQGHIKKKPMQWKMLLDKPKKPMNLSKKVLIRYKRLIGGAIYKHRRNIVFLIMDPNQRSLMMCGKWSQFARKMVMKQMKHKVMLQKYGYAIFARKLLQRLYKKQALEKKYRWRIIVRKLLTHNADVVNRRWRRLAIAAAKGGYIKLNPLRNVSNVKQALKAKDKKVDSLILLGRWRVLIHGILNAQNIQVDQRWKRLVLAAGKKGYIRLNTLKNVSSVNTALRAKNKKIDTLAIQGRWNILIRGILNSSGNRVNQRWSRLAKAAAKQGYIQLNPFRNTSHITKTLKVKDKKVGSMAILGRWRVLINGLLSSQNEEVDQRWKRLTKAAAMYGYIQLNPLRNVSSVNQALRAKDKKVDSLIILGRWRVLINGLLNSPPKPKKQPKRLWRKASIEIMTAVKLSKPSRIRTTPQDRWNVLIQRLLHQIRSDTSNATWKGAINQANRASQLTKKERQLGLSGKWCFLARQLLAKDKQAGAVKPAFAWARMARRLLQKRKIRSNQLCVRWRFMANSMLKLSQNRRLFVVGKFSRLIRKYVKYSQQMKQMKAYGKLRQLTNKLLDFHARALTPIDRWTIVTNKLMKKALTKDVSWHGGFKVAKIKVIDSVKKDLQIELLRRWSTLINGSLKLDLKQSAMRNSMKWRSLSLRIIKKYENNDNKKLRTMKLCGRWNRITTKMLNYHRMRMNTKLSKMMWKYLKARKMRTLGKWNELARKYLKHRSLKVCSKWYKMADRMLCIYDDEHRQKRVDARWLRLMIKYKNKHTMGWSSISKVAHKMRNKKTVNQCWQILVEKMQRKYKIGNPLLNSIVWKARVQKKWNRMMMRFMKKHKLSSTAFYHKISNISKLRHKKATVDERWKILVTQLNKKYHFKGIDSLIIPDVNKMKVKKITVKDRGQLQQNIREGRRRLDNDY